MENNNPKKSKAFIIAFIFILLLLLAGYYLFVNRSTIFNTKGSVTMQKVFAPLLGSSKNKDLSVIDGTDINYTTDQNGNNVIRAEAGEDLKKGDVLYAASYNIDGFPVVMKAIANDKIKSLVIGVAAKDTLKGDMLDIIVEGILEGVPTNRVEITPWKASNPLYLSDKIYGGMTKNPPFAPSFIVQVGSVINVDAINGSIRIGIILNNNNNGFDLTSITIPGNGQEGGSGSGGDTSGKPQCSDGKDNDGDRTIDINDANCHSDGDLNKEYIPTHNSESVFPTQCSDEIDNDGDDFIDKDDPNCHLTGDLNKEYIPRHDSESVSPTQCSDGKDNDGDKKIDAEDPSCHTDGDLTKEYVSTWSSEVDFPKSPYENTCKVIDSNPLEFTDVEKSQLDELLRKFYLIAPNLRTEDDINIAYSEITQYQNFSDHLKTLINQCYKQTADPAYITAGGPTTRFGNPWYQYSTNRGSYIDLKTFDCKYVSGWFSGNGADGKNCETYNTQLYTIKPASCTASIRLSAVGSSNSQDIIYQQGLKNKCIWNPGAKIADLEKIVNAW